ncbi:MAG TPA: helix-turn-helix transcriptional regulator [Spirochaetia bacterium]
MEQLRLCGYGIALLVGVASIMETFMIWQRYRRIVMRHYGLFLVSLFLVLLGFTVDQYARIVFVRTSADLRAAVWLIQAIGSTLFVVICPWLFHSLAGREISPMGKAVFSVIDAAVILAALASVAFPRVEAIPLALSALLFAMIGYAIVFTAVCLRNVGERALRRALVVLLSLTVVFLPLMMLDIALGFFPWLAELMFLDNLAQPAYFLILNCLTIAFGLHYLNRPAFSEAGRLTPYFLATFGVTEREAEIIALLLEGKTTAGIADALFISPKTAENHVYNIYQKLKVRTRVQLFQLIRTNALD